MSAKYRKYLFAGTIAAVTAVPLAASAETYELFGERGPASHQLNYDVRSEKGAEMMRAKPAGTSDAKGEFSAFETVPAETAAPRRMGTSLETGWSTNPAAVYPEGERITP
ncbi:hypothetical protein [Aromatoleum petrolei]|uniref:Uncharacterized protein n=1 Tax=Aromatoleum petrolei TaxID=76116 RepID=A0ABX1MJ45_9RHOO|nr:hypothetical protein [Aromatoleum petrolei]NMF87964.1 hypothetical protein [Aromatoleum petrolei]QTQ36668.1 Uncharacterized protein ToN1_25280 [Aromatoleum petrolei]